MRSKSNKIASGYWKVLIAAALSVLFAVLPAHGIEIKTSPNYLIILVHGIGENNDVFSTRGYGDLEKHLKAELGLDGYVYSFAIKDRYGSSSVAAKQIGGQSGAETWIYNDKTDSYEKISDKNWLESARDKYINWFQTSGPGSKERPKRPPTEAEIPDKYILIAHSMGGLASRAYITSDYYNNDVAKLIAIDVPHLGADGVTWYKKYQSNDGALRSIASPFMDMALQNLLKSFVSFPLLEDLYVSSGHMTANAAQRQLMKVGAYVKDHWNSGMSAAQLDLGDIPSDLQNAAQEGMDYRESSNDPKNIIEHWGGGLAFWLFILGQWDAHGAGLMEMDPEGPFISSLKTAALKDGTDPIAYRLISARGCPTPHRDVVNRYYFASPYSVGTMLPFMSEFNSLPTEAQKVYAAMLSVAVPGAWGVKDGSLLVGLDSSRGENVELFKNNTKRYDYLFSQPNMEVIAENTKVANMAIQIIAAIFPQAKSLTIAPTVALSASTLYSLYEIPLNEGSYTKQLFFNHGYIIGKVMEGSPSIIDQSLDETPIFGGRARMDSKQGIPTDSVGTPTASFNSYDQTFALLSNKDSEGNNLETYHTVTIEAFTEGDLRGGMLFPIEFDGIKKWVSAVTVKEAPTAVKGVINTFLPKKLKQFQYSENFAAWKNVGAVDEWGNFTLKDLNLAEGQNVIAFRAESWTGNKSNQHFKLILNTIPQFVSSPVPEPNSATANVNQKIMVEANKACYTSDPSEKIQVVSFQIDGEEKLAEASIIASQETNRAQTIAEWVPTVALRQGQHDVLVRFQSNVGVSQAIWSFNVDTIAPVVTIATMEPYSARDPTGGKMTIKYKTEDNYSTFLNNLSVRVYRGETSDEDSNFVTEITQIPTQAAGEQFVTWNGKTTVGEVVPDGLYTIRIKAFDQAGNFSAATAPVNIDSTPPQVIEAAVSPNPMTKALSEMSFSGKISENSTVILKLTNQSDDQTTAYLTNALTPLPLGEGPGVRALYTWNFNDPFVPSLRDGVYKLEITARDKAGNESAPYLVNNIRIDRTPPVIFSQYADPFVLANSGSAPYQAVLRYRLSESNDAALNKQPVSDPLTVKVKLFDENSGEMLWTKSAPASLSLENTLAWDASDPSTGKGSYKFQITAYDSAGNYSTAYASCVKDGVAPVISYPAGGSEIGGTVAIKGTAVDPDWTNGLPFKEYRIYYRKGTHTADANPGPEWLIDLAEVPEIYRGPGSARNRSIKAVQNDATLAYLYTGQLEEGEYTILIVVEEEGGNSLAAARQVKVSNSSMFASSANPAITFSDLPVKIDFDGNNVLPISFNYGGKDINAYVEILKLSENGSNEAVHYKYYPNLKAEFYTGKPVYTSGNELGYFIWQDENGWHVRWNGEAGKEHRFNGSLVAAGNISELNKIGDGISQISSIINWDKSMSGGEGGFDFKTDSSQLIISTYIDNDPSTPDDDFSTLSVPFFGIAKYQPAYAPVIITGIPENGASSVSFNWQGKLDTGAFVDNGNYVVRVRAEGVDGSGLTVVEKSVAVTAPFELNNLKTSSASFNPVGLPDRVTVSYNISKDAQIKLKVYEPGQGTPFAIIDGGIMLGKTNPDFPHTISWRGNYPDNEGTQAVTAGNYILKLSAVPVDGSEPVEKEVAGVKVETLGTSASVQLDPIGEEVGYNGGTVRAARGDSDYLWEARASGLYYPPLNYQLALGLQGKQKATVYPYVPFAGIVHRGFEQVDVLVKVKAQFLHRDWWWGVVDWINIGWHEWKGWVDLDKDYPVSFNADNEKRGYLTPLSDLDVSAARVRTYTFWDSKAGKPVPGIQDVRFRVEIYDKDDGFLLDHIEDYVAAGGGEILTEKGIFKISAVREEYWETGTAPHPLSGGVGDTWGVSQKGQRLQVKVKLAEEIKHSRLTNRFVPWFGFINAGHPSAEAFSNMNRYLSKLGFPGQDYFEDPKKSIAVYKAEVAGSYEADIYSPAAYLSNDTPSKSVLESKTRSTMIGDTSLDAQSSYLSGEYIEFIPISTPDHGSFDFGSGIVESESGSGISKRYKLKNSLASYPITAKTDYARPYAESGIELNWPNDWAEINNKQKEQADILAGLNRDPQGYTIDNTAYEIDTAELIRRETAYKAANPSLSIGNGMIRRPELSGILRYDRSAGKYSLKFEQTLGDLIDSAPDHVSSYEYRVLEKYPENLTVNMSADNQNSNPLISMPAAGYQWSTSDDTVLSDRGGVLAGGPHTFNEHGFRADGRSAPIYFRDAYKAIAGAGRDKDLFWAEGENMIDNPNVVVDKWEVTLLDRSGEINPDLDVLPGEIYSHSPSALDHYFKAKLKYHARERRLVKLAGLADSDYELLYFNGSKWETIGRGAPELGRFENYWDVGRLCGEHTVLLKTKDHIASRNVYLGEAVYHGGEDKRVTSAYKRAEVIFKPDSFSYDRFASVTPVAMSEIFIRNRPIILSHGPIVELMPSPVTFEAGGRPFLRFYYTADDIKEGYDITLSPDDPEWENKTNKLTIHQVTANGDLQAVSDQKNYSEYDSATASRYFAFEAAMDHFSSYTMLNGKFSLSAPIVLADRYITNQETVTIYGTAEPGSVLTLYAKTENVIPDPGKAEPYFGRVTAEAGTGNYKFENVKLLQEGDNHIFVTSHLPDNKDIRTYSDVKIIKDTVPPSLEANQNIYAFSPNGDGKYDAVDFVFKSNEKGVIYFSGKHPASGTRLFNEEIIAEPNREYKYTWDGAGSIGDGEYEIAAYAIDEAGNIANNIIDWTVIDTTPPVLLGLNADPNPFTPNDDGVKDNTKFWYKFSEPAYVTTIITNNLQLTTNNKEFRRYETPTENFNYATHPPSPSLVKRGGEEGVSSASWLWDGRGSRNELIGGEYNYSIIAEDRVGNAVTSEIRTIIVDREPSLIPYAFAEPDPFAPVNPANNYTEIKYYLGRDNLNVSVSIQGEGDSVIKSLVNNEVQNKGEHVIRWYGDFASGPSTGSGQGYSGPTAVKNQYRVGDGSYEFKVVAFDPDGGNSANVTNTVLVDNIPPHIVAKPVLVDYMSKKAVLEYNISENSTVEVEIYDEDDMPVKTLVAGEAKTPGDYILGYDFSQQIDAKKKYFKVKARDRALNIAEKETEAFAVVANPVQITEHQVVPSSFTPNGDGFTDLAQIKYKVSGGVPDYIVNIDVQTQTGAAVKTLIDNETQMPGSYTFVWDGKNDGKQLVADGYYEYVITVKDRLGMILDARSSMLVVSTRPTVGLSIDPDIFSPNGDNSRDTATITYSINYPVQYITGDALIKLEVLNASNQAVWSKIFNHTAGTYSYEYNGEITNGSKLPAGNYYLKATAQDALGSTAVPKTIGFSIDYTRPEPTDFSIDPAYARLGARVLISLDFDEELSENPIVTIIKADQEVVSATLESVSGNAYVYSYTIGSDDAEGVATVSVEARDLALNPILKTKTFVIDKTDPQVRDLSVEPNPAKAGEAAISFKVSEPLKQAPRVYVTQNGASSQLAVVGGQWTVEGGQVEARYDVFSGNDGPALISVEVSDLAANTFVYSFSNSLIADTIAPTFSDIQSAISANPEFSSYAREGSVVTIRFKTSESLKFNPDVKINGNAADHDSLISDEYSYKYTVESNDLEGNAAISISGFDFALNEGTAETSSSSESFVIDLVNPTVAIAPAQTPGEYISNPGAFSTNANPDGSDIPRSTTFYYKLAEYSKVTVRVHKVGDSQTTYSKSDFTTSNLIRTLVNDQWQQAGVEQTVIWNGTITNNTSSYDTNNDGYADPGKYAFIVEGRDKAGNLTLKKWGGTVWIQNNVLKLKEPDQQDFKDANITPTPEVNPDPHYISPNGNSTEPTQRRARFYFMINLTLNPDSGTVTAPEKIEAMWTAAPIKKVGKYSVKVYADISMTNLVRTVTSDADAYSVSLTYEDWDGKDDNGQFVADGTYYMVVDVKDYAGNPAESNLLTRPVVVDNTLPVVSNLTAAPYYFSPGSSTSAIKETTLTYEASDNSGSSKITIDVYKDLLLVKTLTSEGRAVNGTYSQVWDGSGSSGYVGTANGGEFADGIYTFKVSAVDEAGNSAEIKTMDVAVDTLDPAFGAVPELRAWRAEDISVEANVSDGVSGIRSSQYAWSGSFTTPADGWGDFTSGEVVSRVENGEWYLHFKAEDNAGNHSSRYFGIYKKDAVSPEVSAIPINRAWATTPISVTLGVSDEHSGVVMSQYAWSTWTATPTTGWANFSNSQVVSQGNDGSWYLHLRAADNTGNPAGKYYGPYRKDNTNPNVGANPTSRAWASSNISVMVTATDAHSGINYSQYVWSAGTTTPSSGWVNYSSGQSVTQSSDGSWYLHLRAYDNVGKSVNNYYGPYRKDSVAPVVNALVISSTPFNQMYESTTASWSINDTYSSSVFYEAGIYTTTEALVKTIRTYLDGAATTGNKSFTWDGTNIYGDYVNEGDYIFKIRAKDSAGNESGWVGIIIQARDDVRITNNSYDSNSPYIEYDGDLDIIWTDGYTDELTQDEVSVTCSGWSSWSGEMEKWIFVDHAQTATVDAVAKGEMQSWHAISAESGAAIFEAEGCQGNNSVDDPPTTRYFARGNYKLWFEGMLDTYLDGGELTTRITYFNRKYYSGWENSNDLGESWFTVASGLVIEDLPNPTRSIVQTASSGNIIHKVRVGNNGANDCSLFYSKSTDGGSNWSSEVELNKLTRMCSYRDGTMYPSITCDSTGNAYVAWTDFRDSGNGYNTQPGDNHEIYFQKVPNNFAPVSSNPDSWLRTAAITKEVVESTQAITFEAPSLVAPQDKKQDVQSIRPVFEWQHRKTADTQEYKIDLAKNDAFSIAHQNFSKTANTGSPDKDDPTIFHYTYSIHEFDPGLDRDTYYWKVTALSTNESATSEVRSFTVAPQLTLTGVTNYPNPFNPRREKTKIRYRLGADADSVKIRIYDVVGSLVTELEGSTDGENSSIWEKYNDIEWDGRNGRGDVVVNGIYPFEVVARLGDKSVSARGKIAVLK